MEGRRSTGIADPSAITSDPDHLMRDLKAASPPTFDVVSTLSHEIRTPLNSIAGYSEMLADAAPETRTSPQWDDVTRRIERSVRELMQWVSITLEVVRLGADTDARQFTATKAAPTGKMG